MEKVISDTVSVPNGLPSWISKYLSSEEIERVSKTVETAEKKTSGEIVPVIVHSSSPVGHVGTTLFFVFLSLFFILDIVFVHGWSWDQRFESSIACLVISAFLAWFLRRFHYVQRVFVPNHDELRCVEQRAELEFHRQNVRHTHGETGILIFISVMERKAVVLADKAVAELCPRDTWEKMVADLLQNLKAGKWSEGLEKSIHHAGEILAEKFPLQSNDKNELTNHLRILE
ncbi:MAG: TPM domain-containing protein [Bdellovibrionota bacterium]